METLGNKIGAKKEKKGQVEYYCKNCDFKCSKKYSWERHISTAKHITEISGNNLEIEKGQKGQQFWCTKCDKSFQTNAGLWKHKNKCNITIVTDSNAESFDKDKLIIMLINQNAELIKETSEFKNMMLEQQNIMISQNTSTQNMMMDVIKNGTHNTTNNTTNSHNKAFNLNFFLNETCKDAMNIMDFVDSIQLQLSDLENVGKLGYVNGISNIIIKNLKEIDVEKKTSSLY